MYSAQFSACLATGRMLFTLPPGFALSRKARVPFFLMLCIVDAGENTFTGGGPESILQLVLWRGARILIFHLFIKTLITIVVATTIPCFFVFCATFSKEASIQGQAIYRSRWELNLNTVDLRKNLIGYLADWKDRAQHWSQTRPGKFEEIV